MAIARGTHLPQTQQHTSTFGINTEQFQSDMGANRNVTDNKDILLQYQDIDPYHIGGVKADDVAPSYVQAKATSHEYPMNTQK